MAILDNVLSDIFVQDVSHSLQKEIIVSTKNVTKNKAFAV